jgi:hypothetical protein
MGMRGAPFAALVLLFGLSFTPGLAGDARAQERNLAAAPERAQDRTRDRDFLVEFQQSLTAVPDPKSLTVRGNVYVPTYSTIRGLTDRPAGLSTLLRIDNTSSSKPLVLERIDYYDTGGKLVQRYLEVPIALRPFGAMQIFVSGEDHRAGPAGNFLVTWAGIAPIAEPLIDSVTFGKSGGDSFSFVSQGRPIRNVGKRPWLNFGLSR